MTVTSTTTKSGPYATNGATTVFAYGFKVFDEDQLEVKKITIADGTEVVLTKTTDYTVSGVGNDAGGNVTMVSTYATGFEIVIRRKMEFTQETAYTNQGPFFAKTAEYGFDRRTMESLENREVLSRALKVSLSDTTAPADLPKASVRANKALIFNGSGVPTISTDDYEDQAAAAAASAAAAQAVLSDPDLQTVIGMEADIGTVAGISANVTTVAGISADVTTVAGDSADIQTVAANIATIASKMNTDLSNAAPAGGTVAEGDILYRGASDWTRLPKGTADQLLKMNSGATAPEWGGVSSVSAADGAVGTPSITFSNDTDCGFWRAAANEIAFSINGAEIYRGLAAGLVFGASAQVDGGYKLQVVNSSFGVSNDSSSGSFFHHTGAGTQTVQTFRQGNPASSVGGIDVSGGTTTNYRTSSDGRLKQKLGLIRNALARVRRVSMHHYKWLVGEQQDGYGPIAQELAEHVPQAVFRGDDGPVEIVNGRVVEREDYVQWQYDPSKMVPVLWAAVQEMADMIEGLEARIAELEGRA